MDYLTAHWPSYDEKLRQLGYDERLRELTADWPFNEAVDQGPHRVVQLQRARIRVMLRRAFDAIASVFRLSSELRSMRSRMPTSALR